MSISLKAPPQRFKFSESWAGPGFCIFLTSPIGSVGCRGWGPQEGDSALSPWHPPHPQIGPLCSFPRWLSTTRPWMSWEALAAGGTPDCPSRPFLYRRLT